MGLKLKWEKVAETQNQNESNWKPEAKKEKKRKRKSYDHSRCPSIQLIRVLTSRIKA